jgi:hypothetical protein
MLNYQSKRRIQKSFFFPILLVHIQLQKTDWQKHYIAGTLAGGITILTTRGILKFIAKKKNFHISERKMTYISSMAGLLISLLAGAGKEIYDTTGRGNPEWQDAMFTAAGGAMISIFYAIPFGRWFREMRRPVPVMRESY